jgi:hypothetical protein
LDATDTFFPWSIGYIGDNRDSFVVDCDIPEKEKVVVAKGMENSKFKFKKFFRDISDER